MLSTFRCKPTPTVIFGCGKFYELPDLLRPFGSNPLIVTGSHSFMSTKHWQQMQQELDNSGYSCSLATIANEPSPEVIDTIVNSHADQKIDVVVAIGGGSVLDSGKAVAAMLKERQPVLSFLEGVGNATPSGKTISTIAIPTTSGTGSEATSNAVISQIGPDGFKKSLRHDNYIPDIALIDPQLTLSCPNHLTLACGMDTFTQLVEGYLSTHSNTLTDTLALSGIKAVLRSFEKTCADGNDIAARTDMAYAAYLSGVVLTNVGLGTIHGFASVIGAHYAIPHGIVCGTLMAAANRVTLEKLRQSGKNNEALVKYTQLGELIGEHAYLPRTQCQDAFIQYLESLTDRLGIASLDQFGISEKHLPDLAQQTSEKNNPIPLTTEEKTAILRQRLRC